MPSSSTHRQRIHRERKKHGLRCVVLEIRDLELDELMRRGLLSEDAQDDREAIRTALYGHLDKTLQGTA
jgi:hypothetical protein